MDLIQVYLCRWKSKKKIPNAKNIFSLHYRWWSFLPKFMRMTTCSRRLQFANFNICNTWPLWFNHDIFEFISCSSLTIIAKAHNHIIGVAIIIGIIYQSWTFGSISRPMSPERRIVLVPLKSRLKLTYCNNVPRGVKNKDNIFTERVSEANEWVKILSLFWTPSGTLTLFHRLGGVCNTRENINIFTAYYIARKNIDIFTGRETGRKNKGKYFYATSLNSTP